MKRFLSTAEYDLVLTSGLRRMGLDDSTITKLLEARWPLVGGGVIAEASGRGVEITVSDVQAFLDHIAEQTGNPAHDARETGFFPLALDSMLQWLLDHERGRPTLTGQLMEQRPKQLGQILRGTKAGAN